MRFSCFLLRERRKLHTRNALEFSEGDVTSDKSKATIPTTKRTQAHQKLGLDKPSKTLSKVRTLHFTSHAKLSSLVTATTVIQLECAGESLGRKAY